MTGPPSPYFSVSESDPDRSAEVAPVKHRTGLLQYAWNGLECLLADPSGRGRCAAPGAVPPLPPSAPPDPPPPEGRYDVEDEEDDSRSLRDTSPVPRRVEARRVANRSRKDGAISEEIGIAVLDL